MKTTVVISLEEDLAEFLEEQGQVDPSALINKLLRDEAYRQHQQGGKPLDPDTLQEEAPSATRFNAETEDPERLLEALSDLDTPAAD